MGHVDWPKGGIESELERSSYYLHEGKVNSMAPCGVLAKWGDDRDNLHYLLAMLWEAYVEEKD